jgi:hypothetical protein
MDAVFCRFINDLFYFILFYFIFSRGFIHNVCYKVYMPHPTHPLSLSLSVQVNEDPDLGTDPVHRAGLTLDAIEGRVDYMSSSVIMTRLSSLEVSMRDEWHVEKDVEEDVPVATTRYFFFWSLIRYLWH